MKEKRAGGLQRLKEIRIMVEGVCNGPPEDVKTKPRTRKFDTERKKRDTRRPGVREPAPKGKTERAGFWGETGRLVTGLGIQSSLLRYYLCVVDFFCQE